MVYDLRMDRLDWKVYRELFEVVEKCQFVLMYELQKSTDHVIFKNFVNTQGNLQLYKC